MAALTPELPVLLLDDDVPLVLVDVSSVPDAVVVVDVVVDVVADLLAVVECALCVTPAKTAAASATPPTAVAVPATASRRRSWSAVFVMAPTMASGASAARH